jgi:hypothetical protein
LWPTTHPEPIKVGHSWVQCTMVPSWTDVRAPTTMRPWSPRRTAPGQTDAHGPSSTFPISTASGCTYAVRSTRGRTPWKLYTGIEDLRRSADDHGVAMDSSGRAGAPADESAIPAAQGPAGPAPEEIVRTYATSAGLAAEQP